MNENEMYNLSTESNISSTRSFSEYLFMGRERENVAAAEEFEMEYIRDAEFRAIIAILVISAALLGNTSSWTVLFWSFKGYF